MWLGRDQYTRRHPRGLISKRVLDLTPHGEFEELVQLCAAYFMLYRNTRRTDSVEISWFERVRPNDSDITDIWVEITPNTIHEKPEILEIECSVMEGEYSIYSIRMSSFDIERDLHRHVEWHIVDVQIDPNDGRSYWHPIEISRARDLVVERMADLIDSACVIIPEIR